MSLGDEMVCLFVRYWTGLEDHFLVHKMILINHTIAFRQVYSRNNQVDQVKTLRNIFGDTAFIDDSGIRISLYNYDKKPFRALVSYLYGVGNIQECGIITAHSETHIRAIHRLASQMGVLGFMDKAVDELYRGLARSSRDLNSTEIDWIYIDGHRPGDRKLREHAVTHGVCRVATVYVTIGNHSIEAGRFFYDCSPQAWRDITEVLINYRKFLDLAGVDCSLPDPNNRPFGLCAFHLQAEQSQKTKKLKIQDEEEEDSAFSAEVQMLMKISSKDEDMEDWIPAEVRTVTMMNIKEEDSTAAEVPSGSTLAKKREYVIAQDEILGGLSERKRQKLDKMKSQMKGESFKIPRREEEDDIFVLKTEQGDLRYTYSTRMGIDVEEQVFKTEQEDLEDHSSLQMEMDVDDQDIFVGKIRSLGPGRSLVGYPRGYGVDGKEYCGKCFVLETEQERLGDSSSAVMKMETDENTFLS
jgi:hypothetical protein